jgi:hypothetical protein
MIDQGSTAETKITLINKYIFTINENSTSFLLSYLNSVKINLDNNFENIENEAKTFFFVLETMENKR